MYTRFVNRLLLEEITMYTFTKKKRFFVFFCLLTLFCFSVIIYETQFFTAIPQLDGGFKNNAGIILMPLCSVLFAFLAAKIYSYPKKIFIDSTNDKLFLNGELASPDVFLEVEHVGDGKYRVTFKKSLNNVVTTKGVYRLQDSPDNWRAHTMSHAKLI